MRTLSIAFALALLVVACAATAPSPLPPRRFRSVRRPAAAPEGDAGPPFPDAEARQTLFSDLVAAVRKYHLFSELTRKNLGRKWEDDLPALETSFARATDERSLAEALWRFDNSLHDGHLWYSPPERVGRGDHLVLGLTIAPEWVNGAPRYYEPRAPRSAAWTGERAHPRFARQPRGE